MLTFAWNPFCTLVYVFNYALKQTSRLYYRPCKFFAYPSCSQHPVGRFGRATPLCRGRVSHKNNVCAKTFDMPARRRIWSVKAIYYILHCEVEGGKSRETKAMKQFGSLRFLSFLTRFLHFVTGNESSKHFKFLKGAAYKLGRFLTRGIGN